MATAMLIPFLLNYVFCWITFFRKEKNKKYTFIFALLTIYPQFEAARIIYLLVKKPSEGKEKKKIFDQDVGLFESCLEAVPSAFIMSAIFASVGGLDGPYLPFSSLGQIIFNAHSHSLFTWIFFQPPGRSIAMAEFLTTYVLSIFSAALGLTKILKNGVARPIAPGGTLDGLLTGKFVVALLASAAGLVARGLCIGYMAGAPGHRESSLGLALTILVSFIPPLLLSLISTLNFFNKSSLKMLYRHPSLIILPTVTFFTFSRLNIGCCSENNKVSFSKNFTYINIAVSTVSYFVWGVWYFCTFAKNDFHFYILCLALPVHVLSILLTALFLHLDKLRCCRNAMEQLSVYDPDLDKRFIMVDGEVVEAPEDDVETPEDDEETGSNTCCRWGRHTEKQQTEPEMVSLRAP